MNASTLLNKAGLNRINGGQVFAKWKNYTHSSDEDLLEFLCQIGHPGEMFTSAAPQDPTFWPLHGLAERFVQYVRILDAKGIMSMNSTWGYRHEHGVASDTHAVCDWSGVEADTFQMPNCSIGVCDGHHEHDTLPFDDLGPFSGHKFTNSEFYNLIHPYSSALPYVYDTLTYWPAREGKTLDIAYNFDAMKFEP